MTPQFSAAADGLRAYLDRVGFRAIYKYLAAANLYAVTPSLVTRRTVSDVHRFFDTVLGGAAELVLLQCLITGRSAALADLPDADRRLADALVETGLLRASGDGREIEGADRQLVSAFGVDLLIDRRIHFGGDVHEVYIGPDSYSMLYYVDTAGIRRSHRAVDLCTGSGIAALYLSLFSDHVLATDIGEVPLELVALNRRLNRRETTVEIRREALHDTLNGRERFDLLTCNPPFVAFPPGYQGTLYAHGPGVDGLGYMRDIIARLPEVLTPGGSAYLVADLCGDAHGPHFLTELDRVVTTDRLRIDAFIDHVLPASAQVAPIASFLRRATGLADEAGIAADMEAFQRDTLRADYYYLTTLHLQTAAPNPGLRIMRRWLPPERKSESQWPALLLAS
ncbi:MAG: methyltransferase [Rhodospirillaceae bacterium]